MWKFDFATVDLVFVIKGDSVVEATSILLNEGDLEIDTGLRDNDLSIIDTGFRILEV
jgi:hypothetical protein